jgi:hypothetical protein
LLGMPHVPEHQLPVVEKGARRKQAGEVGAHHLDLAAILLSC